MEQQQVARRRRVFRKNLQQSEERKEKFDIEFEIKMRLEQARFERRRLELEMQMKELETKHQVLEEERELERNVKRTALETDDARFQSTSARDKSHFNWTPKKRDVSDWAVRIDNLLTPNRSTARFEVTPEVNRHSPIHKTDPQVLKTGTIPPELVY